LDKNVANWWLVADGAAGETLVCLPLRFSHRIVGVVVSVSSRMGCPSSEVSPARQPAHPLWWVPQFSEIAHVPLDAQRLAAARPTGACEANVMEQLGDTAHPQRLACLIVRRKKSVLFPGRNQ